MAIFRAIVPNKDAAYVAAAVALVVSVVALAGTVATGVLSFINARGTLYSNVVTAERSKWINALRGNIA